MNGRKCGNCGNPQVIELATCQMPESGKPGDPVGYVHCPDCHSDTPWHLSEGQRHLICSNRADRKYQKNEEG